MCTLLFAHRARPDLSLVIAANRDELYARPSAQMHFWDDAPDVLAGRDLMAGGTWLGITRRGRWAALTNVFTPGLARRPDAESRGHLVSAFLTGALAPEDYARAVWERGDRYNGFNLVVGDMDSVWLVSNQALDGKSGGENGGDDGAPRSLAPGIHGVSNHPLGAPWPRVDHGRELLARALAGSPGHDIDAAALLDALADPRRFDHTGQDAHGGAPLFVEGAEYGTCSSTVIIVRASGEVLAVERTTDAARRVRPVAAPETWHRFDLHG